MVKILLTGDVHLGRNYAKESPEIADKYKKARMQSLKNAVDTGNRENCEYLVVAGDLFDKVRGLSPEIYKEVSEILSSFDGEVLVLPGNHDYYDSEKDALWKKFESISGSNTRIFKENKPYRTGNVVFYPCICHDKISAENALGWLKEIEVKDPACYHVGIAHGAIEGLSYDKNQAYYYMTKKELHDCGMDAWLIGHTHIPYPETGEGIQSENIFNAGTPQQTDIADNATGEVFIIEIKDDRQVELHRKKTGVISFVRKNIDLQHGESMEKTLEFKDLDPAETSLRVILTGTAQEADYNDRNSIYDKLRRDYIKVEVIDDGLRKEITADMINRETSEGTVMNRLLNMYADDQEMLNLTYDLMVSCKGGK